MVHIHRKRFGQHFLADENILRKMVAVMNIQATDHFVEIGPGQAALTKYLLPLLEKLEVIEIDRDLVQELREKYATNSHLIIHESDVLKFNWQSLIEREHKIRVTGNLPYNISTPLLFLLFDYLSDIQDMHFLLQKEVVNRMTAPINSTDYSRLTVMTHYYCETQDLFDVRPGAFHPPPKVMSAYIRLIPHRTRPCVAEDIGHLSAIVKEAFTYRRKTIHNALKKYVTAQQLELLGIDPQSRPQNLSVADYVKISNHY